jgi:hypothetical protein
VRTAPAKEGEADHRHHKYSSSKRINDSMPVDYSGQTALGREQCENCATGKEGETDHRHHKYSSRKRIDDSMPVDYSGQTALGREQCGMYSVGCALY